VTIVLRDGDLCHYVEENAIEPLWKGKRFPLETCISGWCMLYRRQTVVPDIYADARIPHEAYRPTFVRSLAMIPIRQEEPIGAHWAQSHAASAEELATLQALGDSAAMAIANVQMIQRLQDANRHKDELLAMLAHELRNPLAPIRNGLHVLRLHARDDEDERAGRTRALMERQLQLLSGGSPRGRSRSAASGSTLASLVRESVEDRRALLEAAGLHLDLELPADPVWILGDPLRLFQILGNTLDNAGKFTPAGAG
jgi:signal transduction histidine kinase